MQEPHQPEKQRADARFIFIVATKRHSHNKYQLMESSRELFLKLIDEITNLKFIYGSGILILQCNITVFTRRFHHGRNPPLLRQRRRRSAQLLDRTVCRSRRLGSSNPGLSMNFVDTLTVSLAAVAVVARMGMFLPRPARSLRKPA